MNNNTKPMKRELSADELRVITGAKGCTLPLQCTWVDGNGGTIEEIVTTAPRLTQGPSFGDWVGHFTTELTTTTSAGVNGGIINGGQAAGITITFYDTNRNGKPDDNPYSDYYNYLNQNKYFDPNSRHLDP